MRLTKVSIGLSSKSDLHVSSIITKTGTKDHAGTDCDVVMKICDMCGNCCETGNGLDNRGNDREKGDTDTYTDAANLATCAEKVIDM